MRGTLEQGRVLGGRYMVGRRLGEGGWGAVYAAMQTDLGRPVAIKVLHTDVALSTDGITRFEREARAAAALGHPNIAQVTDFLSRPGEPPFLVMELLSGGTLAALLERAGKLPVGRVAWIAHQVLSALEAAHGAGIVHRDVKPDNVFLVSATGLDDFVKLLDFGIAKLAEDGRAQVTANGAVVGSPAYMSPEQARGGLADARTDLYAVGATMYRALTGKLPFEATTLHALLLAITEQPLVPVAAREPSVDPAFARIVERALHRDPAGRFANASEMRAALEPWTQASKRGASTGTAAMMSPLAPRITAPTIDPRPVVPFQGALSGSPLAGTTGPHTPAGYAGYQTPHAPRGYDTVPSAAPVHPVQGRGGSSSAVPALLGAILVVLLALVGAIIFLVARSENVSGAMPASTAAASVVVPAASVVVPAASVVVPAAPPAATVASEAKGTPGPGVVRPVPAGPVVPSGAGASAGAPSPAILPVVDAGPPATRKQWAGATARVSGGTFNHLPIDATRAAIGQRQAGIDACYAATEFEPPDHQFMGWEIDIEPSGTARAVRPITSSVGRHARLDSCMATVLRSVLYPASAKPSTLLLHMSSRTRDNP